MGDWNSLHLLDEEKYESETLQILQDADALSKHYTNYLQHCIRGETEWSIAYIIETVEMNQEIFYKLRVVEDEAFEEQKWELPQELDDYHFRRFISFLIFRTSAQFFPYFKMGKYYLWQALDPPAESLAAEILDHLFLFSGPFNWDGDGIRKIIEQEDLRLLLSDSDSIRVKKEEDQLLLKEFINFLEFAKEKNLGLLSGQNLDEGLLSCNNLKLDQGLDFSLNHLVYKT